MPCAVKSSLNPVNKSLSIDQSYTLDSQLFWKTVFHTSNRRSLLSELKTRIFFLLQCSLQRNHLFDYLEDSNRRSLFVVENYPLDAMILWYMIKSYRKGNGTIVFSFIFKNGAASSRAIFIPSEKKGCGARARTGFQVVLIFRIIDISAT